MSDLSCLNVEAVRLFMLSRGGKVSNHELVKEFKEVLTNPATRDEARIKFKQIVNTVATISRDPDGELKQLTLRKKYRDGGGGDPSTPPKAKPTLTLPDLNLMYTPVYQSPTTEYPDLSRRASQDSLFSSIAFRSPLTSPLSGPAPPSSSVPGTPLLGNYHQLPTPTASNAGTIASGSQLPRRNSSASLSSPNATFSPRKGSAPSLQGRRSSSGSLSQKQVFGGAASLAGPQPMEVVQHPHSEPSSPPSSGPSTPSGPDPPPVPPRRRSSDKIRLDMEEAENNKENKENLAVEDTGNKISVKERSQKFDRMASEVALHKAHLPKKRQEKADRDEEDGVSNQFDPKSRTWIVRCAQGDYQAVAKLAAESPKLAKFRDPTNTALHWAAKHGNEDLVKLIAGTYKADVNARTGYTPLHIAMQFGHEDVYSLLIDVYGADQSLRDWSGKKPRQYHLNKGTTVSADTFRKIKARKKHAEKDLGFLRIGSLNVRVKKTTEAFSNFLGVGSAEKLHKNWGSADNLPQGAENKKMPPPKFAPIKKRKSKRPADYPARNSVTEEKSPETQQDSDSDAGFGSSWQSTV